MPKAVQVKVDLADGASEHDRQLVQRRAEEGAVLALWESGDLSTRQAAAELGLEYYDFVDLLADRGIPYERGSYDSSAVQEARRKIATAQFQDLGSLC